MRNKIVCAAFGPLIIGGFLSASPSSAQSFDMDCKVILCLAGGFPSGCGDAHSYMLKRLRKFKPPFGVCTSVGSNGSNDTYEVPARLFTRRIPARCLQYGNQRDNQICTNLIQGREEGVISITIPDEDGDDFTNDYVWWSRVINPSDERK